MSRRRQKAWDDNDGQDFDPEMVRNSRALEMNSYRMMNVETTKKPPSR